MSPNKKHNSHYTTHNKIQLIKGGSQYFNFLKELIGKAKQSIYIRIYILDDDTTGRGIADELIKAAERKVAVFLIADGYASQSLSKEFIKNLKDKGVHFKYFEPLFKSTHFYFGRRMHEKVVVVDGRYALVGGINFADRYNDIDGVSAWLDYALYVEGEAGFELYKYCVSDWNSRKEVQLPEVLFDLEEKDCSVRIRRNDWVKGTYEVWRTYFDWFNQAEETITIMCSYFLPGRVLRNRLSLAAKRGVRIKVILAGISDVMLAKHAERYLYTWMHKNNIEIYEYQKSVLHAKMMVVDNHFVTIGSFNVNDLSAYASLELNLDVRNKPFASSVTKIMETIIERDCTRITKKIFITNTTFIKRIVQRGSYEIVRFILNLST